MHVRIAWQRLYADCFRVEGDEDVPFNEFWDEDRKKGLYYNYLTGELVIGRVDQENMWIPMLAKSGGSERHLKLLPPCPFVSAHHPLLHF